jgi:toxin CcdB
MTQFDVFVNPVPHARRTYPYVVILQSDLSDIGRERIVAPLALKTRVPGSVGRSTPHVMVSDVEHVLFVPKMTAVPAADLRELRGQLSQHRESIVAALDYLFLGV